jgi:DNA-binding MarR family transcriptional regulator
MDEWETADCHPSLAEPLVQVLTALRPVLNRGLNESWPDTPLTPTQARLLRILRLRPGISTAEAAEELHEDPRFTDAAIGELERLELVYRAPDPTAESSTVRLTGRGRTRTLAWRLRTTELVDHALAGLEPAERATIALALPALEHLALAFDHRADMRTRRRQAHRPPGASVS